MPMRLATGSPSEDHTRPRGLRCRFQTPQGPIVREGLRALFFPPVVKTSIKTALVVGIILTVINHTGAILSDQMDGPLLAQIVLTFFVPYAVSTYGAVAACRVKENPDETGP